MEDQGHVLLCLLDLVEFGCGTFRNSLHIGDDPIQIAAVTNKRPRMYWMCGKIVCRGRDYQDLIMATPASLRVLINHTYA